jgi:hypothetical protein
MEYYGRSDCAATPASDIQTGLGETGRRQTPHVTVRCLYEKSLGEDSPPARGERWPSKDILRELESRSQILVSPSLAFAAINHFGPSGQVDKIQW